MGIEAHNGIEAFAAILLQSALFVTYAVMFMETKNLGIRSPVGILKNMMTFGMLFILFWVNVVVTLPRIVCGHQHFTIQWSAQRTGLHHRARTHARNAYRPNSADAHCQSISSERKDQHAFWIDTHDPDTS